MTNPTADAAKLLQIQIAHVIADCDGTDCLSRAKTIMNMVENTRPQTAPPEGEPDDCYERVPNGALTVKTVEVRGLREDIDKLIGVVQRGQSLCPSATNDLARDKFNDGVNSLPRWIRERLSLAARPKVEDDPAMVELEVATAVQTLLDSNMKPIADLLERLAGDLQNWWSAAIVAMKAQEAAEAKLAEREAELAKAEDELDWIARHNTQDIEFGPAMSRARKNVAARQQQKGKPNG